MEAISVGWFEVPWCTRSPIEVFSPFLSGPFQDAAFTQAIGVYSRIPIKTKHGYHIILVEGRQ